MVVETFNQMLSSGFATLIEYLTAHVLLCLIPAFFLSGAFNALIPNTTILKYMGDSTNKTKKGLAYIFAATSGLIIEVCSCTILPLFAGIWKKGAGFGPAIAFLFAGPGVTLLSTPLTASIFGVEFAVIKLVMSIVIAVAIGLAMEFTFKETKSENTASGLKVADIGQRGDRKTYQSLLFFTSLTLIMVAGTTPIDLNQKLIVVGIFTVVTTFFAYRYYERWEIRSWLEETFTFIRQIFPILLVGVFLSGAMMPLIPQELVASIAGENTLLANTVAALFGTIAYFPTLVEVPVAKLFLDLGMNVGPIMSYLLVDPGVSLQTLLVVNTIIKPKRTIMYAFYMLVFGILAGYSYGLIFV